MAVTWAAGGSRSLEVKAPLTVTAEVTRQKDGGVVLVHLINFDRRAPVAGAIEVSLRMPEGKQPGEATPISPDETAPQALAPAIRDGRAVFTVPRLKTYAVAVLRPRK